MVSTTILTCTSYQVSIREVSVLLSLEKSCTNGKRNEIYIAITDTRTFGRVSETKRRNP